MSADGERLEHHLVLARRELDRLGTRPGLRRGLPAERSAVEVGQTDRHAVGRAVGGSRPGDAVEGGAGGRPDEMLTGRVGEHDPRVRGSAVAGGLQALGRVDERLDHLGSLGRRRLGGGLVDVARSDRRGRRGQTTPSRIERLHPRRLDGVLDQTVQPVVARHPGGGAGCASSVEVEPQPHRGGGVLDVLMDERIGEPRQGQRRRVDRHLGLGGTVGGRPHEVEGAFGQVVGSRRHVFRSWPSAGPLGPRSLRSLTLSPPP